MLPLMLITKLLVLYQRYRKVNFVFNFGLTTGDRVKARHEDAERQPEPEPQHSPGIFDDVDDRRSAKYSRKPALSSTMAFSFSSLMASAYF